MSLSSGKFSTYINLCFQETAFLFPVFLSLVASTAHPATACSGLAWSSFPHPHSWDAHKNNCFLMHPRLSWYLSLHVSVTYMFLQHNPGAGWWSAINDDFSHDDFRGQLKLLWKHWVLQKELPCPLPNVDILNIPLEVK